MTSFLRSSLPLVFLLLGILVQPALGSPTPSSSSPYDTGKRQLHSARRAASKGVSRILVDASLDLPVPSPFPRPFDSTLSLDLSPTCLNFFSYFLSDPTFSSCRPLSFLLSSSTQFATIAATNTTQLTAVLQATAKTEPSSELCGSWMESNGGIFASRCASDLKAGNSIAQQAAAGFETYALMRSAGALVSPITSAFCYVEAIASPNPDDAFYWSLFSGNRLPNSTKSTCSACTRSLMELYAGSAFNATLSLSNVYNVASNLTNQVCGPDFSRTVTVVTSTLQKSSASQILSLPLLTPLLLASIYTTSLLI